MVKTDSLPELIPGYGMVRPYQGVFNEDRVRPVVSRPGKMSRPGQNKLHADLAGLMASLNLTDGMTFSFAAPGHPEWPPVASGGRYDALTAVLGQGRAIPAVGGIIRPRLVEALC